MKPIATTLTAQATVDLASGEATPTRYERSDFCPVPRAVPILEAMVAFVLAEALIEKLGGDFMEEMLPRFRVASESPTGRSTDGCCCKGLVGVMMKHIFLYGAPGSGKSTVGKLLATSLNLPFFDLDKEIEKMTGKSIPQIMADQGESVFRELESAELKKVQFWPMRA